MFSQSEAQGISQRLLEDCEHSQVYLGASDKTQPERKPKVSSDGWLEAEPGPGIRSADVLSED